MTQANGYFPMIGEGCSVIIFVLHYVGNYAPTTICVRCCDGLSFLVVSADSSTAFFDGLCSLIHCPLVSHLYPHMIIARWRFLISHKPLSF